MENIDSTELATFILDRDWSCLVAALSVLHDTLDNQENAQFEAALKISEKMDQELRKANHLQEHVEADR